MSSAFDNINNLGDEEGDNLPFGPAKRQKRRTLHKPRILSMDVVKELRAVGAEIWYIGKQDSGLLIRAIINRHQVRILIPSTPSATLPGERNSVVHVVVSINKLHGWLKSLPTS